MKGKHAGGICGNKTQVFQDSLNHPEENQLYPIFIGATGVGIGSLLPQQDEMSNHQIILTAGRCLKPVERCYSITEVDKLKIYALFIRIHVKMHATHRAHLCAKMSANKRLQ
jgi:hypothetical protein